MGLPHLAPKFYDGSVWREAVIKVGSGSSQAVVTRKLSADACAILESMGDAFYALDGDWRFVYANQRALDFWGCKQADILGRVIWDCFPALIGTPSEDAMRRARSERRVITFEAPSPVTRIWVRANVGPFGDGVTVYWRDITERRRDQENLQDRETHLRLAQEAAGIGTWEWDLETRRLQWSPQLLALFGLDQNPTSDSDLAGAWVRALHPEDRPRAARLIREYSRVVAPFSLEFRIILPSGEVRWMNSRGNVLADDHGRPRRMLGIVLDETDRRRAVEELEARVGERTRALWTTLAALQRSRERNTAIFENAPVDLAFLRVDPDDAIRIEDVNPAWIQHTGYTREQAVGQRLEKIFPASHAAQALAQCRRAVETRQKVEYEYTATFPVGEVIRHCFLVPLHAQNGGSIDHVLLTAVDLSETRRIEAQLRQAQKMEAIGQLTGGIAHDFNNLLTAVIGNLEMLSQSLTEERALRRVRAAMRAAHRGGELTQQLLAYARRQNLTPQPVDANTVLSGMAELLQRSLGGLVQVEMELAPGLWLAHSDPTQLELMVLNLAINARDAMPGGGCIRLSTRNVPRGSVGLPAELAEGDYVAISVADDGTGMTREVLEHAFEPFFTTKDVGKGSGLGLAQVYGLAGQFGGTARLHSRLGEGTTVEVFLPRAEAAVEISGPLVQPGEVADHDGDVILLVDDDEDVRSVTAEILRDSGYTVKEAATGAAALAILAEAPVSGLLVDFAMPVMSGAELAQKVRDSYPDIPIIYLTGNADPLGPDAVQPGDRVITKPYSAATLLAALQQAIRR